MYKTTVKKVDLDSKNRCGPGGVRDNTLVNLAKGASLGRDGSGRRQMA